MSSLDKVLLDSDSQDEFLKIFMGTLFKASKSSSDIPKGLDLDYLNSFTEFRNKRVEISKLVHQSLLSLANYANGVRKKKNIKEKSSLNDISDITSTVFYEQISEIIDSLLDKSDISLHKSAGSTSHVGISSSKDAIIRDNVKEMVKPQLAFLFDIDNSRESSFRPKFKIKYNKKCDYLFEERQQSTSSSLSSSSLNEEDNSLGCSRYFVHPYEEEILSLDYSSWTSSSELLSESSVAFPDPSRELTFISSSDQLVSLIEELSSQKIIAVDLEHHSYRSFLGLTCLMQISTLSKDYIVDTLKLRLDCFKLGKVFSNRAILKVFHGCEQDILWLQRDFGLYVVNCFDTYFAAKELSFPAFSLAYLVSYYCDLKLDKTHQLSDWRQRPLPTEMMEYAKLDTHYLPFIFNCLVKDLRKKLGEDSLISVLESSSKLCLQRYEKPIFNPLGYKKLFLYQRQSKFIPKLEELSSLQDSALSSLWNWRDEQSRKEDESNEYIMTDSELLRLGITIPLTKEQMESCAPFTYFTQSKQQELLLLFRSLTDIKPTQYQLQQAGAGLPSRSKYNMSANDYEFNSVYTLNPLLSSKSWNASTDWAKTCVQPVTISWSLSSLLLLFFQISSTLSISSVSISRSILPLSSLHFNSHFSPVRKLCLIFFRSLTF
jgi:exosome complex exonuclease RRP6